MFTGIVEELGQLAEIQWYGEGAVITVRAPLVTGDARPGDSIAVSGVCLTVTGVADGAFTADVMKETFDRSALGSMIAGDAVNLERAATPNTRLGGHIVQGHVDGVGRIRGRTRGDRWDDVRIALPPALRRYVVHKGSIGVDGISLTVSDLHDDEFQVSLIPTTLALTTLGRKEIGALVNLEVDVIAKYVEQLVAGRDNDVAARGGNGVHGHD
jgi:riboflavin synthase